MSNIIAIETTGKTSSAALLTDEGKVYAEYSVDDMNHLRDLIPMIEKVIDAACMRKSDIDMIAVSAGPGSFTGIRIGMATAKILAQAMKIPVATVPTLEAFALSDIKYKGDLKIMFCPMLDARRGQVYAGAFTSVDVENCRETAIPSIYEVLKTDVYMADEFVKRIVEISREKKGIDELYFCGDGAEKYSLLINLEKNLEVDTVDAGISICIKAACRQDAVNIAVAADMGVKLCRYDEAEPIYLQRPEAERKFKLNEIRLKNKIMEEPVKELPPEDEKINYRIAVYEDCEKMAELDSECFKKGWSVHSYRRELDGSKNSLYIIAENEKKRLVALAGIVYVAGEAEIERVAVERFYRGRGIAAHILGLLLKDADDKGVFDITLEVAESNRNAIGLYKRIGFKVEGRRNGYYAETGENALIMWKHSGKQDRM